MVNLDEVAILGRPAVLGSYDGAADKRIPGQEGIQITPGASFPVLPLVAVAFFNALPMGV